MSAKDLWLRVHEPRVFTATQTVVYLVLVCAGLYAVTAPPNSITDALGPVMMTVAGVFLIVGGLLGTAGAPGGYWWLERIGLWGMMGGSSSYLTAVVYLQFTAGGNRMFQSLFILAFMMLLFGRMVMISGWDYDPEKDAKRLNAEG